VICVVDASVAVKWFARGTWATREHDLDAALGLLRAVSSARVDLYQPPHFLAEVAAVLCRLTPGIAQRDIDDLAAFEITWAGQKAARDRAIALSIQLNHHIFDTLYHALALSVPGAVLVTADRRYYDKAQASGQIAWLPDFQIA
jgi:predicted nucleic acid-binding protein